VEKLKSICDFNPEQFQAELRENNIPGFRTGQIFCWVFDKGINDFELMTNLSKELRNKLQSFFKISPLEIKVKEVSKIDGTTKVLYQLEDGETVESVMMIHGSMINPERITVCVSTQVGCTMGCSFCATGLGGFKRNLTKGEIIGQVLGFQQLVKASNQDLRVSNVVYMGMGEPLLNYDNLMASVKMLNHEDVFNISYRRISISTCGLVPRIKKLAQEKLPLVLAISLHGATDQVRNQIMPVNQQYPLAELIEVCKYYVKATGRKITFEYIMLDGLNDSVDDAAKLAGLIKGIPANVNLIPYNRVSESGHRRSNKKNVKLFATRLAKLGIEAVVREEKGGDISAACGQLRQARQENRGEL